MIISVVIIIVVSGQALCAACPRGGTGQDQPGGGLIMECLLYKPRKCWPGTLAGCVMVAMAAPDHDAVQLSLPTLTNSGCWNF